ncbi:hypothetical protein CXF71_07675 [Colwellia sp. 12G3]|nr:hypothetical protein CXF71_07675 [Colwellia sp. 12G3]
MLGLVAPNGDGRFFIQDSDGVILSHQTINISLTDSGSYTATVKEYFDGTAEGTLVGTYSDGHLDGVATFYGSETSNFSLFKSIHSNARASLDVLQGYYENDIQISLEINEEGIIRMFVGDCDFYVGVVDIPDSNINLYTFDFTGGQCDNRDPIEGTGMGTLIPSANGNLFIYQLETPYVTSVDTFTFIDELSSPEDYCESGFVQSTEVNECVLDSDNDGLGNDTDTDDDNDGVLDIDDAFPLDPNLSESIGITPIECLDGYARDEEGVCALDTDKDGVPNVTDTDDDNDNVLDVDDAFPLNASESIDTDLDGLGNNTDTDDDNDGVLDIDDAFPLDPNLSESIGITPIECLDGYARDEEGVCALDTDKDGLPNVTDTDDDNDNVLDVDDAFPLNASESIDTDLDGLGNNTDTDDDNDGVLDIDDAFPLDPNEWLDSDLDGIGDNVDLVDDLECKYLVLARYTAMGKQIDVSDDPSICSGSKVTSQDFESVMIYSNDLHGELFSNLSEPTVIMANGEAFSVSISCGGHQSSLSWYSSQNWDDTIDNFVRNNGSSCVIAPYSGNYASAISINGDFELLNFKLNTID